jgi:GTP:adenosylcobinamide-phosphate guanylyltransferase
MDAIVTAGGIPQPDDPLYPHSNGDAKALIDVAGQPMIQWVLDALGQARQVDNVIVVGLSPKSTLTCRKPLHYIPNQGRMLANIVAGVDKARELNPETKYVLVVSSDIPAIKAGMVDWLISRSMQTKDDLYYGVVSRELMEKRFPESKRTYTRLKDAEVCGADMNIAHVRMASGRHLEMWEELIGNRKSPFRQAALIGLDVGWGYLTRSLAMDDLVARANERLGIQGRLIVWEHAEPAMDVDKPGQLEILRSDLVRQQRRAAAALAGAKGKPKKKAAKTTVRKAAKKKTARPAKKQSRAAAGSRRPKAAARKTAGKAARKGRKGVRPRRKASKS